MTDKEKKLLIFPKLEEKTKYLLIFVICSLMRRLIPRIVECFPFAKIENSDYNKTSYFDLLSNFIADFSVGIIKLINLFTKKENSTSLSISIGNKTKNKMKKIFFIYLSFIAIIDIMAQFCFYIFSFIDSEGKILKETKNTIIKEEDLYFIVLIDIISRYIFSKFLLMSHFYKHHIVSIIITCIGFFPFILINIISLCKSYRDNEKEKDIGYYMITYLILDIINIILYSLEDVLNKICLNKLLIRPYELMFYKSLFQIVFVIPLSLYMIFGENLMEYIIDDVGKNIFGRLLYRLSFIISNIFRTWSLITIIELVNPNHLSVLKSSEFAILFIVLPIFKFIKSQADKSYYFDIDNINLFTGIICCIFSLIGSAIHNEVIIINKYGLYECTDYYKTEVKPFSNIDINISDNGENRDSLLGESDTGIQ